MADCSFFNEKGESLNWCVKDGEIPPVGTLLYWTKKEYSVIRHRWVYKYSAFHGSTILENVEVFVKIRQA